MDCIVKLYVKQYVYIPAYFYVVDNTNASQVITTVFRKPGYVMAIRIVQIGQMNIAVQHVKVMSK